LPNSGYEAKTSFARFDPNSCIARTSHNRNMLVAIQDALTERKKFINKKVYN